MAKNPITMLIDAIGDAIGTSHYSEELKVAQKLAGITFDRENYERYRDKTILRLTRRFSPVEIEGHYDRTKKMGQSPRIADRVMSLGVNGMLYRNGLIYTKEMIDAIPEDMKRDLYTEDDIKVLYKIAELQKSGVPLPEPGDWGRILEM